MTCSAIQCPNRARIQPLALSGNIWQSRNTRTNAASFDMRVGDFPEDVQTKACATCGALMPVLALKCTKCESYQNWYRGVTLSTTVLALLTALVSVIGAIVPNFWNWATSGNSRVAVSFAHDDDQGGFFLTATNDGDRSGSIADVIVELSVKGRPLKFDGTLDQQSNPTVEPGKSQKIRYTLDVGTHLVPYAVTDVQGACVIRVNIHEFSGAKKSEALSRDCKDLRPLDFGTK